MSEKNRNNKYGKEGRKDTYILKVKIEGHTTWRIAAFSRDMDKLLN